MVVRSSSERFRCFGWRVWMPSLHLRPRITATPRLSSQCDGPLGLEVGNERRRTASRNTTPLHQRQQTGALSHDAPKIIPQADTERKQTVMTSVGKPLIAFPEFRLTFARGWRFAGVRLPICIALAPHPSSPSFSFLMLFADAGSSGLGRLMQMVFPFLRRGASGTYALSYRLASTPPVSAHHDSGEMTRGRRVWSSLRSHVLPIIESRIPLLFLFVCGQLLHLPSYKFPHLSKCPLIKAHRTVFMQHPPVK